MAERLNAGIGRGDSIDLASTRPHAAAESVSSPGSGKASESSALVALSSDVLPRRPVRPGSGLFMIGVRLGKDWNNRGVVIARQDRQKANAILPRAAEFAQVELNGGRVLCVNGMARGSEGAGPARWEQATGPVPWPRGEKRNEEFSDSRVTGGFGDGLPVWFDGPKQWGTARAVQRLPQQQAARHSRGVGGSRSDLHARGGLLIALPDCLRSIALPTIHLPMIASAVRLCRLSGRPRFRDQAIRVCPY